MSFAAPKTAASPLPDELNGSERWFKKNTQPPRFEDRYSGWLPKIPRVNHMTQMERVDHMANVAARHTRDMLYQLQVKSEADVRERRLRESGPGATHEVLDQTRALKKDLCSCTLGRDQVGAGQERRARGMSVWSKFSGMSVFYVP